MKYQVKRFSNHQIQEAAKKSSIINELLPKITSLRSQKAREIRALRSEVLKDYTKDIERAKSLGPKAKILQELAEKKKNNIMESLRNSAHNANADYTNIALKLCIK